jgi:hypothetical protein
LREKIWLLESKIEKLVEKQVEPGVSSIMQQIEYINTLNEAEKNLKLESLVLKQRAVKEELKIKNISNLAPHELVHETHGTLSIVNIELDNSCSVERFKQALKYSAFQLRKRADGLKHRADNITAEINSSMDEILEHIQAYQKHLQPVLPAKVLANLSKWGPPVTESNKLTAGSRLLKNYSYNHSDAMSVDSSSVISIPSLSPSVSSTAERIRDKGEALREKLLEKATMSVNKSNVKFGSIGSMPLAPIQSHLIMKRK